MTVNELCKISDFTLLTQGDMDKEITKPFCCDLLSVAMSKAPSGGCWVTVMGNINTLAVASLTDSACVVLAEGTLLDDAVIEKARQQDITLFKTDMPIFEACLKVHEMLRTVES